MSPRKAGPDLRTDIRRAAEAANVNVNDYEKAIVLGQLAEILAADGRIPGLAFKGGAIMTLIDGSPRLSADLDGAMASRTRVGLNLVYDVLTNTPRARQIVKRVDEKSMSINADGLRFSVIVFRPPSGIGEVAVSLSIHWNEPLLMDAEWITVPSQVGPIRLPVVARVERAAEKVRAFVVRGIDRDAYDLFRYRELLNRAEWAILARCVYEKFRYENTLPIGADLPALFDGHLPALAQEWPKSRMVIMGQPTPPWDTVKPAIQPFKAYLPAQKPAL